MTAEQANRARERNARARLELEHAERTSRARAAHDMHRDGSARHRDRNRDSESHGWLDGGNKVSVALGAFSVGFGLMQVLAPKKLSRFLGVRPTAMGATSMRLNGIREIASGVGMLVQPDRRGWTVARVAGDALNLVALQRASGSRRNDRTRIAMAAAATVGMAAVGVARTRQLTNDKQQPRVRRRAGIQVRHSVTINRPVAEVYEFWRNFENLPQFMEHLESVQVTGEGTSHWTAKGPAGSSIEWDAELIEDQPNERIEWRSLEDADVQNRGVVRFTAAPGNRGTEVHVSLEYDPPAGKLGALVAKLFGEEPDLQVSDDLRRFKQLLETGEILYSDASLHKGLHPARPSDDNDATPPLEVERRLAVERAADAAPQSSNVERDDTHARDRRESLDETDNSNERSTF